MAGADGRRERRGHAGLGAAVVAGSRVVEGCARPWRICRPSVIPGSHRRTVRGEPPWYDDPVVPVRQVIALAAIGLVAAGVGFAGPSALEGGRRAAPASPPRRAREPTALPEEALPPPAPPAPSRRRRPPPRRRLPRPRPLRRPTTAPGATPRAAPGPRPSAAPAPRHHGAPPRPRRRRHRRPTAPARRSDRRPRRSDRSPSRPRASASRPAPAPTGYEPARRALALAHGRRRARFGRARRHRPPARALDHLPRPRRPRRRPPGAGPRSPARCGPTAGGSRGAASPAPPVLLRDEDGVLLTYRAGQGFVVNPVATTGRWRQLNDDVPGDGARAGAGARWPSSGAPASARFLRVGVLRRPRRAGGDPARGPRGWPRRGWRC